MGLTFSDERPSKRREGEETLRGGHVKTEAATGAINAHTSQETEIASNRRKLEESHGPVLPSASRKNEPGWDIDFRLQPS